MANPKAVAAAPKNQSFFKDILTRWIGVMSFLIAVSFFLHTQDSAYIKITLFQAGSIGLAAIWLISLIYRKTNIFTLRNTIVMLPFILYFCYGVLSYFLHPYLMVRAESFSRFIFYALIFTITAFELDEEALFKISGYIIFTCWVVMGYGAVQVVNNYFCHGVDLLFWTDFFGQRIFSTIANPNFFANFCLFGIILAFARYLHTRQKSLILLVIIGVVDIFFSESKGAWMAFAACMVLFFGLYLNYFVDMYRKHKFVFNTAALLVIMLTTVLVGDFAAKRMQSVNFRLSTWRSTWDMIEAKPVVGTGLGSFAVIYPAYKRPEIFYMEGLHNGETQHAENYYLEQWATLGGLGFGIFLLAVFYMGRGVTRKLKYFDKKTATGAGRHKIYMILGYSMASAAIYIHNFVDVSIYFVSSGFFLALFNGAVVNLVCGPLERREIEFKLESSSGGLFKLFAFIACAVTLTSAFYVLKDFALMTSGVADKRFLLVCVYWVFILFTLLAVLSAFWVIIFKVKKPAAPVIITIATGLMMIAFCFMKSDYYLSRGGSLAADLNPLAAMEYTSAIKLNPLRSNVYQFRAMVFTNRMDLASTMRPAEGDEDGKNLYNDFSRALRDYKTAQSMSPNDILLYYNLGNLYHNMALKMSRGPHPIVLPSQKAELAEMYRQAQLNYEKALLLDPVFDNIYYQLTNMSIEHNDLRGAYTWLLRYIRGPKDVVNPEYLRRNRENEKANMHLKNLENLLPPAEKKNLDAYSI